MTTYIGTLFAVKDIKAATDFYKELFGLNVMFDFGRCVSFERGLSLQQDFDWLTGIEKEDIKSKTNNSEIVFETNDLDAFVTKLKGRNDVTVLHDIRMYPWGQRVIRFYDPNEHLIEVGEAMRSVVERFLSQGMTIADIAKQMQSTEDAVRRMLDT